MKSARIRWWAALLIAVAVILAVVGIMLVVRPSPIAPQSAPAPVPLPRAGGAGDQARELNARMPAAANATEESEPPTLAGFSPVRILVVTGNSFTVEICDGSTQSVLIRWYSDDTPGPPDSTQTVTVTPGSKFGMKPGFTPTAQTKGSGGRFVGTEVGPGQTGACPP